MVKQDNGVYFKLLLKAENLLFTKQDGQKKENN